MDLAELAARESIRDAIASYAHFADGGRFADLAALFAEDGVLEIAGQEPLCGRAAIEAFLNGTAERLAGSGPRVVVRHHVTSTRIDVTGADEATAASYFLVVSSEGPDHWGRYRDRFLRIGDRWLFRHRKVALDARVAGSRF